MSGDEPFKPAILAPGATSAPVSTRQHTIIIAWNTLFIYFLPSSSAFPARIAIRATGTARSVDTPMAPAFQGRRPVTRFPGTSIGSRDSNAPTFPHSHGLCHKYQAAYAFDCSFFSWTSAKSKRESECSHPCNVTISGRGGNRAPTVREAVAENNGLLAAFTDCRGNCPRERFGNALCLRARNRSRQFDGSGDVTGLFK